MSRPPRAVPWIAAGWLAYRNSFTGPFIFDDSMTIRENLKIRHLWPIWDAMWAPVYDNGRMTGRKTNLVYSIDLVRGLDVYRVALPGTTAARSAVTAPVAAPAGGGWRAPGAPVGLVGAALLSAALLRVAARRAGQRKAEIPVSA